MLGFRDTRGRSGRVTISEERKWKGIKAESFVIELLSGRLMVL